jgi:hypothetical protein
MWTFFWGVNARSVVFQQIDVVCFTLLIAASDG